MEHRLCSWITQRCAFLRLADPKHETSQTILVTSRAAKHVAVQEKTEPTHHAFLGYARVPGQGIAHAGIEGLVHISEMSWTRRVNHPSELVKIGDPVEVVVLEFNHQKQEISLGMKQAETNPWDLVEEHYPIGTVIEGTVRNLTAEAIADITSTGETLRANHLKPLRDGVILKSQATLFKSRRAQWGAAERSALAALLERIGAAG